MFLFKYGGKDIYYFEYIKIIYRIILNNIANYFIFSL